MVEKVSGWKAADGNVYPTLIQAAGAELRFFTEQAWAKLPEDPQLGVASALTKAMMAFPNVRATLRKALADYDEALKQAAAEAAETPPGEQPAPFAPKPTASPHATV